MTIQTQQEAINVINALITTETPLSIRGQERIIHDVAELGGSQVKIFWKDGESISLNVSKIGQFLQENKVSIAPKLSAKQLREQKRAAMADDMTDALYDVFNTLKVKPDREIIEKANAMVSTSSAIVNVWKTQLLAVKLSQGH